MSRKLTAEFFGTFWLVLGGCGSAVLAAKFPQVGIGLVGVSLAFGLTLLTMAYTIGPISGCHINPAVTLGLVAGGRFRAAEAPGYIIAQVLGGIVGCALPRCTVLPGGNPGRQTLAPAGSTRGGSGGDEWSEALREKGPVGGQRTVRAATRVNIEQASKQPMWEPTRPNNGEGRRRRSSERDTQPAIPPG